MKILSLLPSPPLLFAEEAVLLRRVGKLESSATNNGRRGYGRWSGGDEGSETVRVEETSRGRASIRSMQI